MTTKMIDQWREMSPEDRELMLDTSEAVAKDYVGNLEAARAGIDPANNGRIHGCDVLGMATALVLAREASMATTLRAIEAEAKVATLTAELAALKAPQGEGETT